MICDVTDHIPLSSSPPSSIAQSPHASVTTKAPAVMAMMHSQTKRRQEMGMGAQVRTPTRYVERIAHTGPNRAIGKSEHNYRLEAMRPITNASSGASANHHHDITFNGDSPEISSTRSEGSKTPLLPFSVRFQSTELFPAPLITS
jgi:hypothetical protein